MGIGLVGAYGIAGAFDSLDKILARRMLEKQYADKMRQEAFENRMRESDLEQRRSYQTAQLDSLRDQREALADQRRQNAAHTLTQDLNMGDPLDTTATETLRAGNLGSLVEHQDATLPSRQTSGFLRTTNRAPGPGMIRTTTFAGNPERDVFRGTPAQRRTHQQQQNLTGFLQTLPADSPMRQALEFQGATGQSAPASLFPREPTPRYSLQPTYDETGQSTGAVRFNTVTGDVSPVDLPPGAGLRTPPRGRQGLPARVQNYLLQLRSKHPRYDDAQAEFSRVLANAPDESFDRIGAATALRSLYAQPSGASDRFDDLFAGFGGENGPDAGRAGAARPAGPTGGQSAASVQPGATVLLKNGQRVRITAVHPDGSFDYEAAQ